uniref:Ornithine carbamoyltransferase n=1 Tax=Eiseniibacteriota bacterium TaxID=2212470 RepID=A0A832I453_UNCEI
MLERARPKSRRAVRARRAAPRARVATPAARAARPPRAAAAPRHYLSALDLSAAEMRALFALAGRMKRQLSAGTPHPRLAGKTLAMIFQKPSLRTRVSFETGMTQLGGHAIYLGPEDIRLGHRETVEDVALTLARMTDGIMARVFGHAVVEELARHATVPVINALSDREHPCQMLGDFLTVAERRGRLEGLTLAFIGDGNNVAHSLMLGGARLGVNVTVACPPGHEPDASVLERARAEGRATGATVRVTADPAEAAAGADVLYTDVWASMGQEAEAEARRAVFRPYRVDDALLARARPGALVMHCLPAHYDEELDYATSRRPESVIFDEAENRLHAQKALLVMLLGR